ncbi:MAG: hypothetical protein H6840_02600 [Planctomycetes bacterium]|nr:hypothetical protein [Planctomycetota bacterium]
MAQTITREIREAAEKAEAKGKEAAGRKEFEKADDYFTFAATTYRRIAEAVKDDEKKQRILGHAGKLELLAKQCRNAGKKGSGRAPAAKTEVPASEATALEAAAPPAEPESAPPPESKPEEEMSESDELELESSQAESEQPEPTSVDIPGDGDEEPADDSAPDESELSLDEPVQPAPEVEAPAAAVAAPPPAPEKPGLRIPRNRKLKRGKLKPKSGGVGPGTRTIPAPAGKTVPPPAPKPVVEAPPAKPVVQTPAPKPVVEAPPPKPVPALAQQDLMEHDASDDTLDEIPDEAEAPEYGSLPVAPVLGPKDVQSSGRNRPVVSDSDLQELAHGSGAQRAASVVISLDAGDFPEEVLKPGEFSIELSPRFTEHLCKALVVGDLAQIASKFHKLADNLTRKAMGGDPRDELDLRFSALACREVADRLLAEPAGDPTREIESARKAYRRGDFTAAAAQYKQAAMRLLGREEQETDEKASLHERQASEYLSFSSRLRQVGGKG